MMSKDFSEAVGEFFELMFLVQDRMRVVLQGVDPKLSPVQILILRLLCGSGEMTQKAIAEKLKRDKSQVAKLIKELERKGLVDRKIPLSDRRSLLVSARPEVVETVEVISARERDVIKEMLQGVSPQDRVLLVSLVERMTQNLVGSE